MTESYLTRYFRNKATLLQHESDSVLVPHAGLRGSHRESLCRNFLADFLPKRYSIGRGMVFDQLGRVSKECDVVVWDDQYYPRIVEEGHHLFLVGSVRCSIEVKSEWSAVEWCNVLEKSKSVRDLSAMSGAMNGLGDRVSRLENRADALERGVQLDGTLIMPRQVATAAIFLSAGAKCNSDYVQAHCGIPDEMLPDLTLILEPGIVIERSIVDLGDEQVTGWAGFRRLDQDALMAFSIRLLDLVHERSSQLEDPVRFVESINLELDRSPAEGFYFDLTRPIPGSRPFFYYQ